MREETIADVPWVRIDHGFQTIDDADAWCDFWRYTVATNQKSLSLMPSFMRGADSTPWDPRW